MLPGMSFFIGQNVIPGSNTYTTAGVFTFTVPPFNTMTVELWGGGGGGGGYGDPGTGSVAQGSFFGATGVQTYFNASTYANGGYGGQNSGTAAARYGGGIPWGAGGGGGNAVGLTVATAGNSGGSGPASSAGAGAPNGGGSTSVNLQNGTAPGGGGAGYYYSTSGRFPAVTGGGGSGGYAKSIFTPSVLTPGTVLSLVVGAGGLALTNCAQTAGNGADGKMIVTWS